MGYDTSFSGEIDVKPPLPASVVAEWNTFASERHAEDGAPSYYCQWVPSDDGALIEWDYNEKFYEAECWMVLVVERFVKPNGSVANGTIYAAGEDPGDLWMIEVVDNRVFVRQGETVYGDPIEVSPRAEV